jgi:23S rRNA U2552 (ribose-2'-O)-methylase RlmE/FtsJ
LIKILEGPEAQAIDKRIRALFERAKSVRPEASRPGTSERYLLGFGFRGSPKRGKRPEAGSP